MAAKMSHEVRRQVLEALAAGANPLQAANQVGVGKTSAYRIHHAAGGVYRTVTNQTGRYLSRDERYEIARLRDQGAGVRWIAGVLGRSPSTISRERSRNAHPRTTAYVPEMANTMAAARQARPKPAKLVSNPALREWVQARLRRRWSPVQVSGRLVLAFPEEGSMRTSHETVYQSIDVHPRGELRKLLQADLRTGRRLRVPRGRKERRGQIVGAVSISERPKEVEGRQVPGHHEGDLICGSTASRSAIATIVERTTGYVTLAALPQGNGSLSVCEAVAQV